MLRDINLLTVEKKKKIIPVCLYPNLIWLPDFKTTSQAPARNNVRTCNADAPVGLEILLCELWRRKPLQNEEMLSDSEFYSICVDVRCARPDGGNIAPQSELNKRLHS